jgi:crotonobetainyl-CoA:carnitine CoA-transferase CaiB-like acyl-CoA transferase
LKFKTRTRHAWTALLEKTDVCFAPVLSWAEAPAHPHLKARGTFVEVDGVVQPAPAPRFSRTPPATPVPPAPASHETAAEALAGWLAPERIARFTAAAAPA